MAWADRDVDAVQKLVDVGDYAKAADVVDRLQNASDSFELQFLKGVAWQHIAGPLPQGPERTTAISNAQSGYQRAAELRPQSSATLNNLGTLNASAGRDKEARHYYSSAIELAQKTGDLGVAGYALNYARYLRDRDSKEAIRQAELAVNLPNPSAEARELLASLYAQLQPTRLLPFAVGLLADGYTDQVRSLAVAGARDVSLPEATRRDWLTLLALALARDARSQVTFDAAPARKAMQSFAMDDPLAAGAKELIVAIDEPPGDNNRFAWWSSSAKGEATGTTSRAAMRDLMISLGDRSAHTRPPDRKLAARYYATAIPLGDRGPDPEAFLSLVNIYADSDDEPALRALMSRYEGPLFSEKGDAYLRQDWALIYRLHVALGMTYAHLGVWDSSERFQNATFQLEAAQRASNHLNEKAQQSGEVARYALPPAAVGKLAESYTVKGRPDLAIKARVDSAEALQKANRGAESTQVLQTIKAPELPAASVETRRRYERLISPSPTTIGEQYVPPSQDKEENSGGIPPQIAAVHRVDLALNKPARQSSRSEWSTANDPQGAVDGQKTGRFGFHTAQESTPWWEVDLEAEQSLSEVRIFNRGDCCAERARTLRVLLSTDGKSYATVYRHDGSVFSGDPLTVPLGGRSARFVRLQLGETTWFHLDEVEVYGQ